LNEFDALNKEDYGGGGGGRRLDGIHTVKNDKINCIPAAERIE
jgi:hypothetical protein